MDDQMLELVLLLVRLALTLMGRSG